MRYFWRKARFPLNRTLDPLTVDVFVSGHTHFRLCTRSTSEMAAAP